MNIHIAAPDIHVGDAVGNHCLGLAEEFAQQGHVCKLFAERFTSPDQAVRPLNELLNGIVPHKGDKLSKPLYMIQTSTTEKIPGEKLHIFILTHRASIRA